MKIYYSEEGRFVVMDTLYFAGGALIAEEINNKIWVKYKSSDVYENVLLFSEVLDIYGNNVGNDNASAIDYLNRQFNKGTNAGVETFDMLNSSKTVMNENIKQTDTVILQALGSNINDVLSVSSIAEGSFVVARVPINNILSLTSDLSFNWIKL